MSLTRVTRAGSQDLGGLRGQGGARALRMLFALHRECAREKGRFWLEKRVLEGIKVNVSVKFKY